MTNSFNCNSMGYTGSIRDYYGKNNYAAFHDPKTMRDLDMLIQFFADLVDQNQLRFSRAVLRKVYILLRMKKNVVFHVLSAYFSTHRDGKGNLDNDKFSLFLDRCTAFLLGAAGTGNANKYVAGRAFYPFTVLIKGSTNIDTEWLYFKSIIEQNLRELTKVNGLNVARSIVIPWWTFKDESQPLVPLKSALDYEHIYPKAAEKYWMKNPQCIEWLGNIALLERKLNNAAKNRSFYEKRKIYNGLTNSKDGATFNNELKILAREKEDFGESDIKERNEKIIVAILTELERHNLLR